MRLKTIVLASLILAGCDISNTRVINNTYHLKGDITSEEYQLFKSHVKRFKVDKISLDSGGGSVYHAIMITEIVRQKGIKIEVKNGDECMSACTFILLANDNRDIKGLIGVHEPSWDEIPYRKLTGQRRKDLDEVKQTLIRFSREGGVKDSFIEDSFNVKNESMMYISADTFNKLYLIKEK